MIFIDESGTLPDKDDKYIVISALIVSNPRGLEKILSKFRKKTPLKGSRKKERQTKEFKFHYVGDITRKKVLAEIASKDIKIFLLVVDKMGRKILDTPENYGKLIKYLIQIILKQEKPKEIFLDKHFGNKNDSKKLQLILESINDLVKFLQVDSISDTRIDLADFIAGAVLKKYRTKDKVFYQIISSKIICETVIEWNKL